MGFGPGHLLAVGDKTCKSNENGSVHGQEVFGDGENFESGTEFRQEHGQNTGSVKEALKQKGASVKEFSNQKNISGEHGNKEKWDQPAEKLVAKESETYGPTEWIENLWDQKKGLKISSADAYSSPQFPRKVGHGFESLSFVGKSAAVAASHDFHTQHLIFGHSTFG